MSYLSIINNELVNGTIPELPEGLATLNLYSCSDLISLPELPEGLTQLYLSDCINLTSLPELPKGLTRLILYDCSSLTSLPELPEGLTQLELFDCRRLTSLPKLPEGLNKLYLSGCMNITSLPELPKGLTRLILYNCRSLTSLPKLPEGLTKLGLGGCSRLTSLPELPEGLTELDLSDFSSLTSLPELPEGLTELDLRGCSSLRPTPELIAQLQLLEEKGCDIRYPDHFSLSNSVDLTKEKLNAVIQNYQTLNPHSEKPRATEDIFHRFLTESVGQRSAAQSNNARISELMQTTSPILDLLETNPNHLEWVEEVAKAYLDGCVNQPVAGISEISAWVAIVQKETTLEKIDAAKYLLTLQAITAFVSKEAQTSPISGVEVEAGNALLREVHKKLLTSETISQKWPGVAKGVAYEGMIKTWLTDDRIDRMYEEITTNILTQTPAKIGNSLCENGQYQNTWALVAFPNEVSEIKKDYAKRRELVLEIMEKNAGSSAVESQDNEENISLQDQMESVHEVKEREDILTKSKELTNKALSPAKNIQTTSTENLESHKKPRIRTVKVSSRMRQRIEEAKARDSQDTQKSNTR